MKKYFLIVGGSLLGLLAIDALVLWAIFLSSKPAPKKEEEKKAAEVEKGDEGPTVKIDEDTIIRLGVVWNKPKAATDHPEIAAYGRIIEDPTQSFTLRAPMAGALAAPNGDWPSLGADLADNAIVAKLRPRYTPTDLVDLRNKLNSALSEVKAATASCATARLTYERTEKLTKVDKILNEAHLAEAESKMIGEEARLGAAQDAVKIFEAALSASDNIKDQIPLALAKGGEVEEVLVQPGEAVESGQPILRVRRFDRALIRVEVPLGDAVPRDAVTARIVLVGHDGRSREAKRVSRAPIDPRTRAEAVLFALPGSADLRPGMPVTAYIRIPGDPKQGFTVPTSAVVRYGGLAWVYVKGDDEEVKVDPKVAAEKGIPAKPKIVTEFVRQEIVLDHLTENGWFVTKGISKKDKIVTQAAQELLSEELKALGGGDAD